MAADECGASVDVAVHGKDDLLQLPALFTFGIITPPKVFQSMAIQLVSQKQMKEQRKQCKNKVSWRRRGGVAMPQVFIPRL